MVIFLIKILFIIPQYTPYFKRKSKIYIYFTISMAVDRQQPCHHHFSNHISAHTPDFFSDNANFIKALFWLDVEHTFG